MKIGISADSTCDLSEALLQKYGITLAPLCVVMNGIPKKDRVEIGPGDIFDFVEKTGELCKTAAVNVADYEDLFGTLLKENDAVIHLCIGSGFSSCYQNACAAAKMFENVLVFDTMNLSTGSGLLVLRTAEMAAEGIKPEEIIKALLELRGRVEASFVVDNIEYLRKGGRCSTVAALGANLLKLKPCIEVADGVMAAGKKYRGNIGMCIESYVKERLTGRSDLSPERIFITHSACPAEIVDSVKSKIRALTGFNEILETDAGCTVSNHCGPNTLGVLFIRK